MQKTQTKCSTLRKLTIMASLAVVAAIAVPMSQADVFTDPVGMITLTVNGTNGVSGAPLSFLGIGLTPIVTNRGVIASVSGTQVTVSNLVAGAFNAGPVGNLYYLEVTSGTGNQVGFTDDIVSNDANSVFTPTDDSAVIQAGLTYKIYPHWTLAKSFGPNDESGLAKGGSDTADQIIIQNPVTQGYTTYYFATATKTLSAGWKAAGAGNTDYSQLPLYQDQGVLINRVGSNVPTNLTIQVLGAVKLGQTIIPLGGTNNFAANVYASSSTVLSNSNLYTDGNNTDSVVAVNDLVLIHNDTTGAYSTYFYANATKTLSAGWKTAGGGNTDAGGTPIPLGANILIQLAPGNNGFNWKAPAPY